MAFFGFPMPSLRLSQFNPSTRPSEEWQLAQLCQPWKHSVASLKSSSPRRARVIGGGAWRGIEAAVELAAARSTTLSESEK